MAMQSPIAIRYQEIFVILGQLLQYVNRMVIFPAWLYVLYHIRYRNSIPVMMYKHYGLNAAATFLLKSACLHYVGLWYCIGTHADVIISSFLGWELCLHWTWRGRINSSLFWR